MCLFNNKVVAANRKLKEGESLGPVWHYPSVRTELFPWGSCDMWKGRSWLFLAILCCGVTLLRVAWGAESTGSNNLPAGSANGVSDLKAIIHTNTRPATADDLFAVNIVRKKTSIHRCTGALITPSIVLLPGSCIVGKSKRVLPESHPNVRIGSLYIDGTEGRIEVRKTSKQIVHPSFEGTDEDGYSNDLALLVLDEPVVNHTTIGLAPTRCNTMEALGWFKSGPAEGGGAPSKTLERAESMESLDKTDCEQHLPHKTLHEGMFCAIGPPRTSNEWDHGALLLCPGNPEKLLGLASYRSSPLGAKSPYERSPYAYTDLPQFSGWIQSEVKKAEAKDEL